MYLVKLYEGPVPSDGTAVPLFDGGVQYGQGDSGVDGPLRRLLKNVIRIWCSDPRSRYFVQVWDEERQAWYKPWNGTWFEPPADGLIPCENVSKVGPLNL